MAELNYDGDQTIHIAGHPSGIMPTLQNIVSTVDLGCLLDLKAIALHARNAEYNPKRYPAVIMRSRQPRTTALIFASGKMVCTGAKSEEQSRRAARKYTRVVQKIGFEARFLNFKIQNIVCSCDVQFPIKLEGLMAAHSLFSTKPKIVLLIFVSGKIVLTGAKSRQDTYDAFEQIYLVISEFKKSPKRDQVGTSAPQKVRPAGVLQACLGGGYNASNTFSLMGVVDPYNHCA